MANNKAGERHPRSLTVRGVCILCGVPFVRGEEFVLVRGSGQQRLFDIQDRCSDLVTSDEPADKARAESLLGRHVARVRLATV